MTGATVIGQVISMGGYLVMTRLYLPEDFGLLAIFTAILTQLLVFVSLRYDWAIPLPKTERQAHELLLLCLLLSGVFTVLSTLGITYFDDEIVTLIKTPKLKPFLYLLPPTVFIGGCYQAFNYWALRRKEFKLIAHTKINQSLASTLVPIGLAAFNKSTFNLLLGTALNYVIGTGKIAMFWWKDIRTQIKKTSLKEVLKVGLDYRQFPTFVLWSGLFNMAGLNLPTYMLAYYCEPSVVGSFALAQRITSVPSALIGSSISQVFLGSATTLVRENPKELRKLQNQTIGLLLSISLGSSAILLLSPWLILPLIGNNWAEAVTMIQWLVPAFVIGLVGSSITMLEWLEQDKWIFLWNLCRMLFVFGGFWLGHLANLAPTMMVAVYSGITFIMYAILLLLNIHAVNLLIKKNNFHPL